MHVLEVKCVGKKVLKKKREKEKGESKKSFVSLEFFMDFDFFFHNPKVQKDFFYLSHSLSQNVKKIFLLFLYHAFIIQKFQKIFLIEVFIKENSKNGSCCVHLIK